MLKYRQQAVSTDRVIAYIDGFNLYYGMRAAGLRSSRWLDLRGMQVRVCCSSSQAVVPPTWAGRKCSATDTAPSDSIEPTARSYGHHKRPRTSSARRLAPTRAPPHPHRL